MSVHIIAVKKLYVGEMFYSVPCRYGFITFKCIILRTSQRDREINWPLLACQWPISSGLQSRLSPPNGRQNKRIIANYVSFAPLGAENFVHRSGNIGVQEKHGNWRGEMNILKVILWVNGELRVVKRYGAIFFVRGGNVHLSVEQSMYIYIMHYLPLEILSF